jgi:hypothetical protein
MELSSKAAHCLTWCLAATSVTVAAAQPPQGYRDIGDYAYAYKQKAYAYEQRGTDAAARNPLAALEELQEANPSRYGQVFPYEQEYYGYDMPFDAELSYGYEGPLEEYEQQYLLDGDNYGYGGYDFGYGDVGYRESLGLDER